jgi:hypothetical protein
LSSSNVLDDLDEFDGRGRAGAPIRESAVPRWRTTTSNDKEADAM